VIELGPEAAAGGSKIVLEAKEEADYTITEARKEIETAKKNRDAQVGVFVFSRKTAPAGIQPLSRIANDIFVVWDSEDIQSDLYLKVGLSLAKALCSLQAKQREAQATDFTSIDEAILAIEKRAGELDQMATWARTIQNSTGKISKQIQLMKKALMKQVRILRDRTNDLKSSVGAAQEPEGEGYRGWAVTP
jgi:hypothetical protein